MIRAAGIALLLACAACGEPRDVPGGGEDDAPDAAAAPGAPDGGGDVVVDAAPGNACEEAGVTAGGACASATEIVRCVDGDTVEHEACTGGATCAVIDGVASCLSPALCGGVGPLGRCDGDTLWRCDGAVTVTDCAATGAACAYQDDDVGYACVDAGTLGSARVAGVIRREERALSPGTLGPITPVPARGTMVAVVDDGSDELLATASAADDGSYVLHYDPPAGTVRVVAYSRSRATARPARVRNQSGYLHAVGGASFTPAADAEVDLLITIASQTAGAWNALDTFVTGMDWLRAAGVTAISPLIAYWQLGSNTGSYYMGGTNELYLDGDDGHDDVVALHELGHYIQDEYSASDNPGGAHDGSPADPRLAWGEGSATWLAIALRDAPYYIDYSAGGGWSVELEDRVHAASPGGAMSQAVSEWMVAEIMWDVSDGAADGDGDAMSSGDADAVLAVMLGYLPSDERVDRGFPGVDLVEWLDGWYLEQGSDDCTSLRGVVRAQHGFPYDFAGPAGACP